MLLPREILDQITSLNTQHRDLLSTINHLSRPTEIAHQQILDDLVAKLKAEILHAERGIENLETALELEDDPAVKREGSIHVAKISEDLNLARALFRRSLLQASKTLQQSRREKVTQLLLRPLTPEPSSPFPNTPQSSSPPPQSTLRRRLNPSSDSPSNDSYLLSRATDVTLALKRTHSLLEQELEKSSIQAETLEHSSQTLQQLEHKYSAFDVLLTGSRRLIRELESADKWDRYMIYAGLAVFGLTCLWITWKRLLRGPVGLVVWGVGKALGTGGKRGSKVLEGSEESQIRVTVEVPALKKTGFAEKRDEMGWSAGVIPTTIGESWISDVIDQETQAAEVVL